MSIILNLSKACVFEYPISTEANLRYQDFGLESDCHYCSKRQR